MQDYQSYRQGRIEELNSLGYNYIPPGDYFFSDLLDDGGEVITPLVLLWIIF